MFDTYDNLTARLRTSGDYLWPLVLRLIMFWEFWESGITKLRGENWFAEIPWADWQRGFPWPLNLVSVDLNWLAATWGELIFAVMILFGLFTRFAAVSLLVITVVATAAVHWPAEWGSLQELWKGYVITPEGAGNFKLPLLFVVILLPLIFHGGGKISLDHLLLKMTGRESFIGDRFGDGIAAALMFAVLGIATYFLEPAWGITCFALALVLGLTPALRR
ncbi:MAG: DoxX family protein [Xanthomonadales bacterium]|nr:DoxX family protein [Gammaproteobacteria bacterium]MBT8053306.1 DoxX family protein [Gammaproteobacteria bacterium]NND58018.1 DoxX family protein [Xanthomonadales bacterium]NNK52115.1 DoxX family protein [Xanthomonadales bacterium]